MTTFVDKCCCLIVTDENIKTNVEDKKKNTLAINKTLNIYNIFC